MLQLQPSLAGNSILDALDSQAGLQAAFCHLLIDAHLCLKVAADELRIAQWDLVLVVSCMSGATSSGDVMFPWESKPATAERCKEGDLVEPHTTQLVLYRCAT